MFIAFLMHAYGKIRTVHFAPAASVAPVRIDNGRLAIVIQRNALSRAESSADAAAFTPVAKDIDLEALAVWLLASTRRIFSRRRALNRFFAARGRFAFLQIAFHHFLEI
jgi:hypothetical protein